MSAAARAGVAAREVPVLNGEVSLTAWQVPGPKALDYLTATDPIIAIMGPQGSGKTTTSVVKAAMNTLRIPPCRDGVIRAKGVVIRDNYRTLYRTTLETWFRTFPRDFTPPDLLDGKPPFEGGQDRPAVHRIMFRTERGHLVRMDVDFYAVGDHAIEDLLKGYEPTWGYCNEADILHERVPPFLYGRTGRYPPRSMLANPDAHMPRQVFCDLNPPDVDHWVYRDFVEKPKPGYRLIQQPSGLADDAENRQGVRREYYVEQLGVLPERDIVRMVHGRFGYSLAGKPVYADFDQARVLVDDTLDVLPGLPLHAGYDQGLSPALELFQVAPDGQVRFLDEVVPPHGTGPARFAEMVVAKLNEPRFRGVVPGHHASDPAGFYGADRQGGEISWTETVSRAIGITVMPAPSQDPGLRIEALRLPMMTALDAKRMFLAVDPACRMLRKGLAAQYMYARQRQNNRDVYGDRPVKNEWSHPVEAAQYGVLAVRGRAGIIETAARAGRPGALARPQAPRAEAPGNFDVWSV